MGDTRGRECGIVNLSTEAVNLNRRRPPVGTDAFGTQR